MSKPFEPTKANPLLAQAAQNLIERRSGPDESFKREICTAISNEYGRPLEEVMAKFGPAPSRHVAAQMRAAIEKGYGSL